MKMKTSDVVATFLESQGISCVFELVGGMITHLLDSIQNRTSIRIVSVHHEQAAAFAADAFGRLRGLPGVALATSGPGATNLLTGIGSCYFDSTPAVFITGQVNRGEQKGDRAIRQLGFQETDIVAIARPITKWAVSAQNPDELPALLRRAFETAVSGRPGPVLIDIPMDVQRAEIEPPTLPPWRRPLAAAVDRTWIARLFQSLREARRPLILAGGGIRSAQAADLFRELAGKLGIPVVTSLMGIDVLPYDHPLRVGMIGSYGNRWANLAIARSDCLLVLGSRLDVRQTGARPDAFRSGREIYHVDCEAGEMNNRVVGCETLVAELRPFLEAALSGMPDLDCDRESWRGEIADLRAKWPDTDELRGICGINPNRFFHRLSSRSGAASTYVVDVGQHQMWAAQSLELGTEQRFLTSGGMGAMGFALPAAVGAACAVPGRPVVLIAGDGGFQVNSQELQTIARGCLPVKMVVLNNRCHGMVRQFQEGYFDRRYQSTLWGYSAPDFARVAQAYGIDSKAIESETDFDAGLEALWRSPAEPFLLEVMIDTFANAYPKIAFGRRVDEMEPAFAPAEMEST